MHFQKNRFGEDRNENVPELRQENGRRMASGQMSKNRTAGSAIQYQVDMQTIF